MPDSSSVALGPKLGKLIYSDIGGGFANSFRTLLRALDQLIQCTVKDIAIATPPGSPADGDAYIVATGGTGAWSGKDKLIAAYSASIAGADTNVKTPGWEFYTPKAGWVVYSAAQTAFYYYTGATWQAISTDANIVAALALKANLAGPTFTGGIVSQNTDYNPGLTLQDTTAASTMSPNLIFKDNQAAPKNFYIRKVGATLVVLDENAAAVLTIPTGGGIQVGGESLFRAASSDPTNNALTIGGKVEFRGGNVLQMRPGLNDFDYRIQVNGAGSSSHIDIFSGADLVTPLLSLTHYGPQIIQKGLTMASGRLNLGPWVTKSIGSATNVNDLDISNCGSMIWISGTPASPVSVTGLKAGASGDVVFLLNNTSQPITFAMENGGSVDVNRIRSSHPSTSPVIDGNNGTALFLYDGLRWNYIGLR